MEDFTLVGWDKPWKMDKVDKEVSRRLREKEWSLARLRGGKALRWKRVFGEQLWLQDQMNRWENTDEDE